MICLVFDPLMVMILRMVQSSSRWGRSTWKGFSTTPSKRSTSAPTLTLSSLQSETIIITVALSDINIGCTCQVWGEEEEGQGENSWSLMELTSNEGSREHFSLSKVFTSCHVWSNFVTRLWSIQKLSITYRTVPLHTFVFFSKYISFLNAGL